MKFTRPRIVIHTPSATGVDASGNPTTVASVSQTAIGDLILGNGSVHSVRKRTRSYEVSQQSDSITSLAFTTAGFTDIEQPLNGSNQVFLTVNVVALGTSGGLRCRLEFQDPDHPEFWIPSKEGINRESDAGTHNWDVVAVGNHILASRVEHHHFRKFRARFTSIDANPNDDTKIVVTWHHAGKISLPEDLNNDPDAPAT